MKTCIYGAGAIGGWLGVRLAQAGCEVSVVARGPTLAALRRDGLGLMDDQGQIKLPVHASADPRELGVQQLVVIAVKAPSLLSVAQQIAPLLGPDTLVLVAMNGVPWWFLQGGFGGALAGTRLASVDPDGALASAIPSGQVIGAVVHASCSLAAPGLVRHHFGQRVIVGELSGAATLRVQQLAALLERGGIEAPVSRQIQHDIWFKLWGNMTVNPISALTGATTDLIMGDALLVGFITAVMLEAKAIGARIGITIADAPAARHAVTRQLGAFKTSMLQDVEAGRATELDALVGAVRELGQLTQVPTPFTDALLGLARVQARRLGLYPA